MFAALLLLLAHFPSTLAWPRVEYALDQSTDSIDYGFRRPLRLPYFNLLSNNFEFPGSIFELLYLGVVSNMLNI